MSAILRADWREDLLRSRDLRAREISAYSFFVGWYDSWRVSKGLKLERDSAKRFWCEVVLSKRREKWQEEQWAEAMRWILNWAQICQREGKIYESICERLRSAIFNAGARRGLSRNTLKSYAGWVVRYGMEFKDERAIMDEKNARQWLADLVVKTKISFATQKQALNALVFFYRDVCGREKVDLKVQMRKRSRHIPVVFTRKEVMELIDKIQPKYRLQAQFLYAPMSLKNQRFPVPPQGG